ncbi:hypothetical protein ABPG75_008823 [Micractinium tetrahymenae]
MKGQPGNELQRMRSLAEWLVRRGAGAVQRLELHLTLAARGVEGDGLDDLESKDDGDQLEVLTDALQAIAFCTARGGLQELEMHIDFMPSFRLGAAMAAALAGLRRLQLRVSGGDPGTEEGLLAVVGPLHTMTALQVHRAGWVCRQLHL